MIEFDSSAPIWRQLMNELARRIAAGDWAPGERIPGVRDLAADFGVNPNTAQRALAELERTGLCRSERTAGRFVTDDPAQIDRARNDLARGAADDFIDRARGLGMTESRAAALIKERWNHRDHSSNSTEGA